MIRKLLLAGGDRRMLLLAPMLKQLGYEVDTMGLVPGDEDLSKTAQADAVLFPYPFSVKNGVIPTLTGLRLKPETVLESVRENIPVLAGRGLEPYVFSSGAALRGLRVMRYTCASGFEEQNAAISAEAAVHEAMLRLDRALMDTCILVTGYGAFGRALAGRLRALGAHVWVAARRREIRELAAQDGMETAPFEELLTVLPEMQMVLNTVPAQVMGERELRCMRPDTWLLELASAPYGFDRDLAHALGLRTALLPGLPALYAPVSAALALKNAVTLLLKEA